MGNDNLTNFPLFDDCTSKTKRYVWKWEHFRTERTEASDFHAPR